MWSPETWTFENSIESDDCWSTPTARARTLTAPESVPVREAATSRVVRDGERGLEVFMVRRTTHAVFSPGAHVFPGGALDVEDRVPELEPWCDGLDDGTASVILGVPTGGLGYYVAAARECFEEAGLLLASSRTANS